MAQGSIQLNSEKVYRHQTVCYLTLSDVGKLRVNFVVMPSYTDVQDQFNTFKINQLPHTIEWSNYKNQ
jgi:hypothetical protein